MSLDDPAYSKEAQIISKFLDDHPEEIHLPRHGRSDHPEIARKFSHGKRDSIKKVGIECISNFLNGSWSETKIAFSLDR